MSPSQYTRIVLSERPEGNIDDKTFRQESLPFDLKPGPKQILVKVDWLSLDPAMRGWLRDVRSYVPPVQIGEVMRSAGLATVVEAGSGSKFSVGELVSCLPGWAEYAVVDDKTATLVTVPSGAEPLDFLGPLGMTGLTAYFGLLEVGKVKKGDTLVVSGAAGATGSIVCQIGKKRGAKVVAIAGSEEKCRWLKDDIGVDLAFNYKSKTFYDDFKKQVGYLDLFFDNVGGEMLNFMLTRLNQSARIVLCGAISDYNNESPQGLKSYMSLITQRARMEGFIVFDYAARYGDARAELASWLTDGSLKRKFEIVEGLQSAPTALPMLFSGGNTGKLVVRVSGPSARL
ncbi:alcohol dehydrogenase [Amylostereum chailletii]|nr:alcohol dehydrogenase [Amylostereum chailletii]